MRVCLSCAAEVRTDSWHCDRCGHQPERLNGFTAFAPELAVGNEGFDDAYFAELFRLESDNYWFRARNELLRWALQKYFPCVGNYLEIGCGTGFVLAGVATACPGFSMHASEISTCGLPFATSRVPQAKIFQMDARVIPYVEHFDIIGLFDVLEHIEEDGQVLRAVHRALKSGGGLIMTVPQHRFLWSRYDEHAHHVRRYGVREITEKVKAAGFRIVMTTSFVSLLLPLMAVSRLARPALRGDYDAMADLRVGWAVNFILESVLVFERSLIRFGIRFPAGGSRLLLAQRIS